MQTLLSSFPHESHLPLLLSRRHNPPPRRPLKCHQSIERDLEMRRKLSEAATGAAAAIEQGVLRYLSRGGGRRALEAEARALGGPDLREAIEFLRAEKVPPECSPSNGPLKFKRPLILDRPLELKRPLILILECSRTCARAQALPPCLICFTP